VEEFSNLPLDEVTTIFEQQYQKEAAEDKAVISKALEGLHRALLLSVAAVVSDPVARVTYAELGGRRVGATRPSEYYRTETPEESVSHWVYAVRRRVQRALSTLKEGQE
jgi:hypothetical protein